MLAGLSDVPLLRRFLSGGKPSGRTSIGGLDFPADVGQLTGADFDDQPAVSSPGRSDPLGLAVGVRLAKPTLDDPASGEMNGRQECNALTIRICNR